MWRGIGRGGTPRWRRLVRSAVNGKSMGVLLLATGIVVGIGGTLLLRNHVAPSPSVSSQAASFRSPASAGPVVGSPSPSATEAPPVAPPARAATVAKAAPVRHHLTEAVSDRPSMQVVAKAVVPAPPQVDLKSNYSDEQSLVERARNALRGGIPADAYAIAQEHARRFPDGALAEERELIAIRALKALQQRRAMVERILEFHRRHPNSLLIPAVDALAPSISGD
jgi:hypothetical protein